MQDNDLSTGAPAWTLLWGDNSAHLDSLAGGDLLPSTVTPFRSRAFGPRYLIPNLSGTSSVIFL